MVNIIIMIENNSSNIVYPFILLVWV